MKHTTHAPGTIPSRIRTLVSSLGSTINQQAALLKMPPATLNRRQHCPEDYTIGEVLKIFELAANYSATTYTLQIQTRGKRDRTT
jgi:hypothetical protein